MTKRRRLTSLTQEEYRTVVQRAIQEEFHRTLGREVMKAVERAQRKVQARCKKAETDH